jgi:peptidase-like protein
MRRRVRASGPLGGACQVDVEVRCLKRPVHSGQKGGPIPDPVQILCRLIAGLTVKDGASLTVIAFEAQPFLGSSNQILDSVRARIAMRTVAGVDSREAGQLLIRKLTRNPPHGARVQARISRLAG